MPELAQPQSQQRIGRYEVLSKLGEGGMAETFLCRREGTRGFKRHVVVKSLMLKHAKNDDYLTMFSDEARVGAALSHPGIPRVEELGEHAGVPFMVQEYIEGPNLLKVMKAQRARDELDRRLGVRVVIDVARALHHAYTATDDEGRPLKVVHRDISPSNVLVSTKGSAKLIDFGIARFSQRETKTRAGVLKGKLRYMAPEAILHGSITHQSDIYSLGSMLYLVLAGKPPWAFDEEVGNRLRGKVTPPSQRAEGIDDVLDGIVLRSLSIDLEKRYPSSDELADDLEAWLKSTGGEVDDAYVANRIGELFPKGSSQWLENLDLDLTRSFGTPHTNGSLQQQLTTGVTSSGGAALPLAVAFGLAAIAAAVVLIGAVGIFVLSGDPPEAVVVPEPVEGAPGDNDVAERLLGDAAAALDEGDAAGAASHLRAAADLQITDPVLRSQREKLQADLSVSTRTRSAERMLEVDPAEALQRALELDAEYPGYAEVQDLLDRAQAAVAEAKGDNKPAARPRPRPRPSATTALLAVEGSPRGATVLIDGALVGELPLALELKAGDHRIRVEMDGYETLDSEVTLKAGRDRTLQLDLRPVQAAAAPPTPKSGDGLQDPFASGQPSGDGLQDPFATGSGSEKSTDDEELIDPFSSGGTPQ